MAQWCTRFPDVVIGLPFVSEAQAALIAEAVRKELKRCLDLEFPGGIKSASQAVGIPTTTLWKYFSPDEYTANKRGIPLTILATVADWLHEERGYPEFGILWRDTRIRAERGELD